KPAVKAAAKPAAKAEAKPSVKKPAAAKKPAAKKGKEKAMAAPHYQIIRRPIITEKGLGVKENHHTVVFEVAAGATKTEIKEAVQQIFKVKVADVRTANFHGKM